MRTDTPGKLNSKCAPVPHLGMVIAGTGYSEVVDEWRTTVLESMLAIDLVMLDQHTPNELRQIWANFADRSPELFAAGAPTTTVYHLGFTEETGECVGFAYRSTNSFVSEGLPPGFRIKPGPRSGICPDSPTNDEEIIELASMIRSEQDGRPLSERIHIGCDLILTTLHDGAISSRRLLLAINENWVS